MRMTSLKISLVVIILCMVAALSAQVQFTGRVLGNDMPNGIEGARITLVGDNDNYETESGDNGNFTFPAVIGSDAGILYRLTITFDGYQTHRSNRVVRNQNINLGNIRLNEYAYPPREVTAEVNEDEDAVIVSWEEPTEWTPSWLHWDSGINANAIGTGAAYQFTVAARFTPLNFNERGVVGLYITSVRFFPREEGALYTVKIWRGGSIDPMNPGQEVYSRQLVEHNNFAWNEVEITEPVPIEGNEEIWIGYHINTPTGFPAGVDAGPHINNYGNLIHFAGAWNNLVNLNPDLTFNWNIQGYAGVTRGDRSVAMNPAKPNYADKRDYELSLYGQDTAPVLKTDPNNTYLLSNIQQHNGRERRMPGREYPSDANRELEGYRIYRYNTLFFDEPDRWIDMGTVEDPVFEDTTWVDVDEALYRYAVQAIYTGEVYSPMALSNTVSSLPPDFSGGDGSAFDPWIVATPHNLRSVGNYLGQEHNDKYFLQVADIDIGQFPWNYRTGWIPIGSSANNSFQGNYDGDGFTISNMFISRRSDNQGLFGYTNGAVIENVVLDSVFVEAGSSAGALVGYSANLTTIRNSSAAGYISGINNVGGLVGYNDNSTVTGCSSSADVITTGSNSGGLVGMNFRGGKVINSFALSYVSGVSYTGGLVGYNNGIRDEDCGTIIDRSFSAGFVTGSNLWVGGLTGRTFGSIIRNCYSSASVSAFGSFSGALIGQHCCSSTLINSYAVGYTVSTGGSVGGLMGQQQQSTTENSYWNRESTSQNNAPQGQSKTTAEMVQRNTYENWDFDDIWSINAGNSYPYFQWQENAWQHNIPGPLRLEGEAGDALVELSWQAPPVGELSGYRVYRDGVLLNSDELITETEFADSTVVNFLTYTYRVSAILGDDVESGLSNPVSVTPFMFEDGDGSQDNPYMITDAGQINIIRFNLSSHFILGRDIDLGVEPWNSGEGWVPIGTSTTPFTGSLNGDGFNIANLTINRLAGDFQGLFGATMNATISNLGIENVSINSRNYTGAFVGYARSTSITGSYVTGNISGSVYTGGFTGYQTNLPNLIANSYNASNVHCTSTSGYVGGLVGYYYTGTIENCYSIGRVSFVGTTGYIGGLLGHTWTNVTVNNSYWNIETSGQETSSGGGEGKTTAEMIDEDTFNDWNFDDIWAIGFQERVTYPYLLMNEEPKSFNYPNKIPPRNLYAAVSGNQQVSLFWLPPSYGEPDGYNIYRNDHFVANVDSEQNEYQDIGVANLILYEYTVTAVYGEEESDRSNASYTTAVPGGYDGGLGTADNPYQIATAAQLNYVRHNREASFIQTDDISLQGIPSWTPIGSSSVMERFIGTYDGDGYDITGLTINNPADINYLGLFGFVGHGTGAVLRNITVRNANIRGANYIGILAGRISDNSIVHNCYLIGDIEATGSYIGGAFGYVRNTEITNTYSAGSVEAAGNFVGGLTGYNYETVINNCYSTSNVEGGRYVGGFTGYHRGSITNSYSRGGSTGTESEIGGFAGLTEAGHIANSYSTGRVSGPQGGEDIGGFIGRHSSGNITACYWDTQSSGTMNSPAGEGRTTEQMTFEYAANTYIDWDFDEIWNDDRTGQLNNRYPYLYWYPLDVSPNPAIASNPNPANQSNNVSIDIEEVRWSYIEHLLHTNPVGFRVYMNTTGIFGAQDPYIWVPYIAGQENYSSSEIIPQNIAYGRTYYWRVIPTTIDPDDGRRGEHHSPDRRRHNDTKYGQDSVLSLRGDAERVPMWRFTTEISPHPTTARNPQPANGATNIPLDLTVVAWTFSPTPQYTNPVGFRVYMNTTGEFDHDEEFVWVPFVDGQRNYSCVDIVPERLSFNTAYYWKVVPTTERPNRRSSVQQTLACPCARAGGLLPETSSPDVGQSLPLCLSRGDHTVHSPDRRRRNNTTSQRYNPVVRGDAENVPVWNFTTRVSDPNPHPAHDPEPEHLATGVSLGLPRLSWEYEAIPGYAIPAGFRVYLNMTGSFPGGSPYQWVPYIDGQSQYSCSEAIPFVLDPNTTYYWRVVPTTIDPTRRAGRSNYQDERLSYRNDAQYVVTWRFTTGTTDIEDETIEPLVTELLNNYPNPFNPETNISFALAEASDVTIEVYNSRGQKVITLFDGYKESGRHRVVWNGRDSDNREVGSGIYFYRMNSGSYTSTNRMVLLK